MDIGSWCSSSSRGFKLGRKYIERSEYDELSSFNIRPVVVISNRSRTPRWKLLWRRIKKEKNKLFYSSSSSSCYVHHQRTRQVQYDPYTYSQNFDHGSAWNEPDNHSRSFSARFAVPSTIFQKKL
ncbi:hypothetical protein MKW98_008471 [Papaver atlanticum]|uniref:Uncharacterized protein n=1 Tax=Papaver atlanticum TaxID=357466 RepID=A0AAD4XZJ6_9MAGN|nr:hypothetical protein MKW98_008471 [Papaver atlanticum]